MTVLDRLITQLSRLPGIGRKSASRIVYYLLSSDPVYAKRLAGDIGSLHDLIKRCKVCGNFTETERCEICSDSGRDGSVMCVVEQPQDIAVIESSGEYRGLYHVLFGVIAPLDGVGPERLNLGGLSSRLRDDGVQELIIATNPTVDGDATALYLKRLLDSSGIQITRLALGLPVGGDLEYADRLTVARSLRGRLPLS